MNGMEAYEIIDHYYRNAEPASERNGFIEAEKFLIETTGDPGRMMDLGGFYYEQKEFELALKYYEMAEMSGYEPAAICLGYVWYYGRTGTRDFEKAFRYFKRSEALGNPVATYKIADMYKNGYYVEKDYENYKDMVEKLYQKLMKNDRRRGPIAEVASRLARIRKEEGEELEAVRLFRQTIDAMKPRIQYNGAFFGDLNIMKWAVNDLYQLVEFDPGDFGLYDLYFRLQKPCKVHFSYALTEYTVESVEEDEELHVRFEDRWFRSIDDFFTKAEIDGETLTRIEDELTEFVIEGEEAAHGNGGHYID